MIFFYSHVYIFQSKHLTLLGFYYIRDKNDFLFYSHVYILKIKHVVHQPPLVIVIRLIIRPHYIARQHYTSSRDEIIFSKVEKMKTLYVVAFFIVMKTFFTEQKGYELI